MTGGGKEQRDQVPGEGVPGPGQGAGDGLRGKGRTGQVNTICFLNLIFYLIKIIVKRKKGI